MTQTIQPGAYPVMYLVGTDYLCAHCGADVVTFEQTVKHLDAEHPLFEGKPIAQVTFRVTPCGHRTRWLA